MLDIDDIYQASAVMLSLLENCLIELKVHKARALVVL